MPGIYKIGFTEKSPMRRAAELSSGTSMPTPFEVVCYGECADPRSVEKFIHEEHEENRLSAYREFFRFDEEEVITSASISIEDQSENFIECNAYREILAEFQSMLREEE